MRLDRTRTLSNNLTRFKSFDPFSRLSPTNIIPLDRCEENDLSHFIYNNPNGYPIPSRIPGNIKSPWNVRLSKNALIHYLYSRKFQNIFKASLAFTVASLFTFIPPLTKFFGRTNIFVPITLIYADMRFTVGGLINTYFFINVFLICGLAGSAISTLLSQNIPVLLLLFMFLYVCVTSLIVGKYPRIYGPYFVSSMLYYDSVLNSFFENKFDYVYLLKSYFAFFIGGSIFFLIGIIVFPYRAFGVFRKQISSSLDNIGYLLTIVLTTLLQDPHEKMAPNVKENIKTEIMAVRFNFSVLLGLLKECRLEFDYNYFHYKDYKHLINTLVDLLGHLSSMASCIRIKTAKKNSEDENKTEVQITQDNDSYFNNQDTIRGLQQILDMNKEKSYYGSSEELADNEMEKTYIYEIKDQIENILKESCAMLMKLSFIFTQDPSLWSVEENEHLFSDIWANWEEIQGVQKKMVAELFANSTIYDNEEYEKDISTSFKNVNEQRVNRFLMNFLFIFSLFRFVELLHDFQKQVMKLSRKDKFFHIPKWKNKKSNISSAAMNLNLNLNTSSQKKNENDNNSSSEDNLKDNNNNNKYTISEYIFRKLWEFSQLLKGKNIRFGLKVAVIICLFSILAFYDGTKQWYYDWNGKWAVITVFAVSAPTYAGELINSIFRSMGTLLGGFFAVISWEIFDNNPYALCVCGFILSFIMNHFKNNPIDSAKLGCVTLTTFVIVLFGQYATNIVTPELNENIWLIGVKRVSMVLGGIFMAILIGRFIWPSLARIELRCSLAKSLDYLGILYNQIMNKLMSITLPNYDSQDELKTIIKIERNIQLLLIQQRVLLALARHEPRIRGPFQPNKFLTLIRSSQLILDLLRSIRVFVETFKTYSIPDPSQLIFTWDDPDCRDLITNITLCLYLYSAAIQIRKPLPFYLPDPSYAHSNLSKKVLLKLHSETNTYLCEFWIGYYAFTMCISEIISGLKIIELTSINLYGKQNMYLEQNHY